MRLASMRSGWTLIELIFVISIVGILATIGTQIFSNLFVTYLDNRIHHDLNSKTELVLTQITNRLTYRIKPSTILSTDVAAGVYQPLESATTPTGARYALEWIGYDNDSRRGIASNWNDNAIPPAWSGLIDLQASNANTIIDPQMDDGKLQRIIGALSYNRIDTTVDQDFNGAVLIYPNASGSVADFGWYDANATLVHPVHTVANTFVPSIANTFSGIDNEVYEHYYLAHSAYAVEYQNGTLTLYYNYRPWAGEKYTDGNRSILTEHATTFKMLQIGTMLKLQLCLAPSDFQAATLDNNYSICKEQAVY